MTAQILHGDCLDLLRTMDADSVHCCVTSPPYWGLRDYGVAGQLGLEATPEAYVARMVEVFREVRRVLRGDGTLWLNLGDSYASTGVGGKMGKPNFSRHGDATTNPKHSEHVFGRAPTPDNLKPKDLVGIPWRVAFALQSDGWYLRQDIIWAKPNPMPESVRDRCTKAHEYLFLLAKSERYWWDADAMKEAASQTSAAEWYRRNKTMSFKGGSPGQAPQSNQRKGYSIGRDASFGRNRRSVWTVSTRPYKGAHFATFPPKLIEPCILAGCPVGGTVLDPFTGSGTTGAVAISHGRNFVGCELNADYIELAKARIAAAQAETPLFAEGNP